MARLSAGGKSRHKLFSWFEQDAVPDADGMISPAELPYDVVTLRLSEPKPGEQVNSFPARYSALTGLIFLHPIERQAMGVKFSVLDAATMATGAAGALLAKNYQGRWVGGTERFLVALDVQRPVRKLELDRPLSLQRINVNDLLVRPYDDRGEHELAAKAAPPSDDVTVVGKPSTQAARLLLVVGRDRLEQCSSVQYRRRTQQLLLSCQPGQ